MGVTQSRRSKVGPGNSEEEGGEDGKFKGAGLSVDTKGSRRVSGDERSASPNSPRSTLSSRMSWVQMVESVPGSGGQLHLTMCELNLFDNFRQKSLLGDKSQFHKTYKLVKDHNNSGSAKVLGAGMQGSVFMVKRSSDQKLFALKTLKVDVLADSTSVELHCLTRTNHPGIVRVHDVFQHKIDTFLLTFELGQGGDMFRYIKEKQVLQEALAARLVRQMMQAVHYLHLNNIVHRDLKLENFVFRDKVSKDLMLIDFGLSTETVRGERLVEKAGTVHYMAPEVFQKSYSFEVDLWSLGVIAFMLLSGKRPFVGKQDEEVVRNIMACNISFFDKQWAHISPEARNFVESLLVLDPAKRLSPARALEHPFLKSVAPSFSPEEVDRMKLVLLEKCVAFSELPVLKQLSLKFFAIDVDFDAVRHVRPYFDWLVGDNPGVVSFDRLKELLEAESVPEEDLLRMYQTLDNDNKLFFCWSDLVAIFLSPDQYANDKFMVYRIFRKLSMPSEDKLIHMSDLEHFFGEYRSAEELDEIMHEVKSFLYKSWDPKEHETEELTLSWTEFATLIRRGKAQSVAVPGAIGGDGKSSPNQAFGDSSLRLTRDTSARSSLLMEGGAYDSFASIRPGVKSDASSNGQNMALRVPEHLASGPEQRPGQQTLAEPAKEGAAGKDEAPAEPAKEGAAGKEEAPAVQVSTAERVVAGSP